MHTWNLGCMYWTGKLGETLWKRGQFNVCLEKEQIKNCLGMRKKDGYEEASLLKSNVNVAM